jgi:hypothetical protein
MAAAQPETPPITPAEGTAVIAVLNVFTDGNAEDEVEVNITCSSGSISPTSATLGDGEGQQFVVSNIPDGAPTTCSVTTGGEEDYSSAYLCAPGSGGASTTDPESCSNPDFDVNIATSCFFEDVQPYEGNGVADENVGYCGVISSPEPVDVDVTKVWEMFGAQQDDVNPDVGISLFCDAEIVGGTEIGGGIWTDKVYLRESDGDYDDEDGDYVGEGVATFMVIPDWYATAADPDDQEYTECWASENITDSAVESESDCGTSSAPGLAVAAGMGDSCTITNTVFFEGIPTLSQYGMAIMALLMLGVGFIGMRRFV